MGTDLLGEPALLDLSHAHADESAFGADHFEFRMLPAKRFSDIGLVLRPARSSDGDALQAYVRGLSPRSRYNRFLGGANELPASELARALAASGRDTLTLLLTSMAEGRETVVGEARVALVIDDLGRSLADLATLQALGVPLTYAVLPFESQTPEVVSALRRSGEEILCHLPMEPRSGGDPGPGALRLGMSPGDLRRATTAALDAVPGATGVNNHMGSGLSADRSSMTTILTVLSARGLYFLDSRTSPRSVGFSLAAALGVPSAERQVFLDDDQRPAAVHAQFQRLLELARSRGEAIAIGHPHPATLAALAAEVPRARAGGVRFVQVSALLRRSPPGP